MIGHSMSELKYDRFSTNKYLSKFQCEILFFLKLEKEKNILKSDFENIKNIFNFFGFNLSRGDGVT